MRKLVTISLSIALATMAQVQSQPQNSHKPTSRHPHPRLDETAASQPETTQSVSGPVLSSVLSPLIVVGGSWTAIGPAPIPNGQTIPADANGISLTQAPVSGRLTAIAIDPADPNTAYVGAAQGGVYQTRDGGTTWTPLMDSADTQAVGSLELDPTDSTGNTLWIGSGESNFSGDSFAGLGVYKITNLKSSPVLSGPFGTSRFIHRGIPGLAIDPHNHNNIYAGSATGQQGIGPQAPTGAPLRGLYRSIDGGATFTKIPMLGSLEPTPPDYRVTSIVYEPGSSDRMFVGVADASGNIDPAFFGGIYFTANASAATPTFTRVLETFSGRSGATGKNFVPSDFAPIKLAANKVDTTVTVVAVTGESVNDGNQGKAYKAVYNPSKPGNLNLNFTELNAARGFAGGQGSYNIAVAIDPRNASNIYAAGTLSSNGEDDGGRPVIDDGAITGDQSTHTAAAGGGIDQGPNGVFIFSRNGGVSFTPSTDTLHVDSHMIGVAPSNPLVVYTGNDGGVWRSDDGGAHWIDRNTSTFSATQFQSIAVHPTDPNFSIGGTQDNGTNFFRPDGTWTRADFGDGGYALIDQTAGDTEHVTMYHTYFNLRGVLIGFGRITKTSCAREGQWSIRGAYTPPIDPTVHCDGSQDVFNGISLSDNVNFYAPMALGPGGAGNPNTVYFGTNKLYRSDNRGDTMPVVSQSFGAVPISDIGISKQSDNVRIVGLNNGKVFATVTGGNPLTDISQAGMPAKYLARAVIDPNHANTAYVAYNGNASAHVFKTTNLNDTGTGTVTWTEKDTGIPDISVNAFLVDPANSNHLYAGTDRGVFVSTDGGDNWNQFGTGLPNVAVFDLAISADRHLRAATHGRGFYEIPTLAP